MKERDFEWQRCLNWTGGLPGSESRASRNRGGVRGGLSRCLGNRSGTRRWVSMGERIEIRDWFEGVDGAGMERWCERRSERGSERKQETMFKPTESYLCCVVLASPDVYFLESSVPNQTTCTQGHWMFLRTWRPPLIALLIITNFPKIIIRALVPLNNPFTICFYLLYLCSLSGTRALSISLFCVPRPLPQNVQTRGCGCDSSRLS